MVSGNVDLAQGTAGKMSMLGPYKVDLNHKVITVYVGNPGVKLRLTRKGAEHVKDVGVKLLNEQLARLNGFKVQHPFSQPGGLSGHIYVSEIQTLAYQPPQASHISFQAPSYIIFSIENAAIRSVSCSDLLNSFVVS